MDQQTMFGQAGEGSRTCKKCGETKPLTEFHMRLGKRVTKCKTCVGKIRRNRYSKNHPEMRKPPPPIPEGYRWCYFCKQAKTLEESHPKRLRMCRECVKKSRKRWKKNPERRKRLWEEWRAEHPPIPLPLPDAIPGSPELDTGIYCIECIPNGKRYIGHTTDSFPDRWIAHQNDLNAKRHCNPELQYAWNKYGPELFRWHIVERVVADVALCESRENYYMALYRSADPKSLFNVCEAAGSWLGRKHTAETKAKISTANRNRIWTAESRARSSESHKGLKYKRTKPGRVKPEPLRRMEDLTEEEIAMVKKRYCPYDEENNASTLAEELRVHWKTIYKISYGR